MVSWLNWDVMKEFESYTKSLLVKIFKRYQRTATSAFCKQFSFDFFNATSSSCLLLCCSLIGGAHCDQKFNLFKKPIQFLIWHVKRTKWRKKGLNPPKFFLWFFDATSSSCLLLCSSLIGGKHCDQKLNFVQKAH